MNVKCRTRPSLAQVWVCAQLGSSRPYQSLPPLVARPGDPVWPPCFVTLFVFDCPFASFRGGGRGLRWEGRPPSHQPLPEFWALATAGAATLCVEGCRQELGSSQDQGSPGSQNGRGRDG